MSVYVKWYNKVVEDTVVNEHDLFDMVAVGIPVQGIQMVALFHPKNVYKTVQDACGSYPKHFPTPGEIVHHEPRVSVAETVSKAVGETGVLSGSDDVEYQALQQFKRNHWDNKRNMLQLDYWPEFDRMYHAYQRRRIECTTASKPKEPATVPVVSTTASKPKKPAAVPVASAKVSKPKKNCHRDRTFLMGLMTYY